MKDQAETLRKVSSLRGGNNRGFHFKTIAITSGKGGVGKTNVVVNLALSLVKKGKRVTILDADFGLANIDILLGLSPEKNIAHIVKGNSSLEDVMVDGPMGIKIIPASSGIQELTKLTPVEEERIFKELSKISSFSDMLLIDTAAGISDIVLNFLLSSEYVIVVLSPEPTSIVDAYAVVKVLSKYDPEKKVFVLANAVKSEEEAEFIYLQLSNAVERFLSRKVDFLGYIVFDENIKNAVMKQKALVENYPQSKGSLCFYRVADKLIKILNGGKMEHETQFWKKLINRVKEQNE